MFFKRSKSKALVPPPGLGRSDICKQSSICTGETLIGFLEPKSGRLLQAVVVHSLQDEIDFYHAYGFAPPFRL